MKLTQHERSLARGRVIEWTPPPRTALGARAPRDHGGGGGGNCLCVRACRWAPNFNSRKIEALRAERRPRSPGTRAAGRPAGRLGFGGNVFIRAGGAAPPQPEPYGHWRRRCASNDLKIIILPLSGQIDDRPAAALNLAPSSSGAHTLKRTRDERRTGSGACSPLMISFASLHSGRCGRPVCWPCLPLPLVRSL